GARWRRAAVRAYGAGNQRGAGGARRRAAGMARQSAGSSGVVDPVGAAQVMFLFGLGVVGTMQASASQRRAPGGWCDKLRRPSDSNQGKIMQIMKKMLVSVALFSCAAVAAAADMAGAPFTFISPFPPGGGTDTL